MHAVPESFDDLIPTLTFPVAVGLCDDVVENAPDKGCHAVVMADEHGVVIDKVVMTGELSFDHAIGWAAGFHRARGTSVVLVFSTLQRCVQCIDPLLMFDFDRARFLLDQLGIELRDWMVDDGYATRSLAFTQSPHTAWLSDPPELRGQQLAQPDPGLVPETGYPPAGSTES